MRLPARLLAILLAAACASSAPFRVATSASTGMTVACHGVEIPRQPVPGFHRDGLVVTSLAPDSAWARAGVQVDDVLSTANGTFLLYPEDLWRMAGGSPREVRVVRSERGVYGGRVLTIEVTP